MQNSSQKTQDDVDIADVAYYFEKDVSINYVYDWLLLFFKIYFF